MFAFNLDLYYAGFFYLNWFAFILLGFFFSIVDDIVFVLIFFFFFLFCFLCCFGFCCWFFLFVCLFFCVCFLLLFFFFFFFWGGVVFFFFFLFVLFFCYKGIICCFNYDVNYDNDVRDYAIIVIIVIVNVVLIFFGRHTFTLTVEHTINLNPRNLNMSCKPNLVGITVSEPLVGGR